MVYSKDGNRKARAKEVVGLVYPMRKWGLTLQNVRAIIAPK
jgi:hypothetical protein